jgi:TetR/AcrR family transcriptional repressor of nem operon
MKKAERTRQAIVQKAAALFNQKGYAGTSLQDIIQATGLSKGGLYGHFKGGKEELAIAAFSYAVQSVYAKVGDRTRVIDNTVDKLKTVIYFYREHIFNPPIEGGCPIQNTSIEADDNQPALRDHVLTALKEWKSRLVYTIKKGQEKGEINEEVDASGFATYFIGSLEGGIMLSRIEQDTRSFDIMTAPLLQKLEQIRIVTQNDRSV